MLQNLHLNSMAILVIGKDYSLLIMKVFTGFSIGWKNPLHKIIFLFNVRDAKFSPSLFRAIVKLIQIRITYLADLLVVVVSSFLLNRPFSIILKTTVSKFLTDLSLYIEHPQALAQEIYSLHPLFGKRGFFE